MLIAFRVGNYRSFLHEQELSYVTSPDRAHETTHCIRTGVRAAPRVSRAALIFGPNAGGKTNLILALSTLRDLVLNSISFTDEQFAERYIPFKFEALYGLPTRFEIEVLLDRVRYHYMLAYNSDRVLDERLLVYRTGKSQRWFDRHFDPSRGTEEWAPFSPNFTGPREMWRKATRGKALFLTTATQLNSTLLQPLFHWFEYRLEIVLASAGADLNRLAADISNPEFKQRMLSIVQSADIPIDDLRVAERTQPQPPGAARNEARQVVEFLHAQNTRFATWLGATFESGGTHRLLALLGPLLRTIDNGAVLVIDEFDTSLHPLLSRFLMRLTHHPVTAGRDAQLLVTSHNTTLMDLDILRRDEMWFAELDERQATVLRPLLRSSPRKHEVVMKAYLRGRYGAIPKIPNESGVENGKTAQGGRLSPPATALVTRRAAGSADARAKSSPEKRNTALRGG